MSDTNSQRNLAVVVAVVAAIGIAGVVGFVVGRDGPASLARPSVGSNVAAGSPAEEPLAAPPAPDRVAAETPPVAPRASATTPTVAAPATGARKPQTAAPAPNPVATEESALQSSFEPVEEPDPVAPPVEAPVARDPDPVEIPEGTKIQLALEQPLSSQVAAVGDRIVATLTAPIRLDGEIVVPSGTRVSGRVTEAKALAKVGGQARLALAFESLEVEPASVPIAAYWAAEGKSETGKDAATIAAGAAIGTILGNQAKKNDRGKVVGAVVGAGVGTAVAAATKGEAVELSAGTTLELTLRQPVRVVPPR